MFLSSSASCFELQLQWYSICANKGLMIYASAVNKLYVMEAILSTMCASNTGSDAGRG